MVPGFLFVDFKFSYTASLHHVSSEASASYIASNVSSSFLYLSSPNLACCSQRTSVSFSDQRCISLGHSVVSLVTEDKLCSLDQIINLFNSNGTNGTIWHPQNCIDELYVAFHPSVHA
jgi:type IV secretory pathway TraG/TraD family ATPase VirD4